MTLPMNMPGLMQIRLKTQGYCPGVATLKTGQKEVFGISEFEIATYLAPHTPRCLPSTAFVLNYVRTYTKFFSIKTQSVKNICFPLQKTFTLYRNPKILYIMPTCSCCSGRIKRNCFYNSKPKYPDQYPWTSGSKR